MNEAEQLYALRTLHQYLESRISYRHLELTATGLRMLKRYVLFCVDSGSEEDVERALLACLAIPELKEWILGSQAENLKPVKERFAVMCKTYDPGELGPSFLPFT